MLFRESLVSGKTIEKSKGILIIAVAERSLWVDEESRCYQGGVFQESITLAYQ